MKKKRHTSTPRRKSLKRPERLEAAGQWLVTYTGSHIVKGYAKWFGVDLLCSIQELRLLGVTVTVEYEENIKRVMGDRIAQQRKLKEKMARKKEFDTTYDWLDENYAFIAGYTTAGFAFGVTWEENERFEKEDNNSSENLAIDDGNDDLPF